MARSGSPLVQGGNLSGSLALPASFDDIIVISWENSKCTAIMPPELAGRASGPLRLPPCSNTVVGKGGGGGGMVSKRTNRAPDLT